MPWVSMVLTKPEFTVDGMESLDTTTHWPKGCAGVLLCWDTKKASIAHYGRDVKLVEIQACGLLQENEQ